MGFVPRRTLFFTYFYKTIFKDLIAKSPNSAPFLIIKSFFSSIVLALLTFSNKSLISLFSLSFTQKLFNCSSVIVNSEDSSSYFSYFFINCHIYDFFILYLMPVIYRPTDFSYINSVKKKK